jgi:alpha-1,2-mannosyltransferase
VPEWSYELLTPWTTPAALMLVATGIGWLLGLRGRRLALLAAAVAFGTGVWQGWKIGPPSGLLDLQIYVGAGRDWLHGTSLYDYHDGVHNLSATYPPIGPVFFALFVPMSAEAREVLWSTISLVALGATAWFAAVLAGVERERRTTWALWAFAAATVTLPAWLTLRQGQVNIVLWLLIVSDVVLVSRRSRWSGIGIGVATAVKLVPGLFIVWLLLAGKRASAARAVVAALAATALGWLLAPSDSRLYWTELIFNSDRIGRVDDTANNSVLGVVARAVGPGHVRTAVWLSVAAAVLVVALWRGVKAARAGDWLTATAVVGCAGSLLSPISWTHHLGFAVLALAAFSARRPRPWAVAGLVAWWIVLVSPGGHGNEVSTSTVRALVLLGIVLFLPIVAGRTDVSEDRRRPALGARASGGDDAEDPVDEVARAVLEGVAADGHATQHVGAPLDHEVGQLVDGLARVEREGAEDRTLLAGEDR